MLIWMRSGFRIMLETDNMFRLEFEVGGSWIRPDATMLSRQADALAAALGMTLGHFSRSAAVRRLCGERSSARRNEILEAIPNHPRGISCRQLCAKLNLLRPNVQRELSYLVKTDRIQRIYSGPAFLYSKRPSLTGENGE